MINLQRYRRKHFWLEFVLLAVQVLPYITTLGALVVSTLTFAVTVAKFKVEGLRPNAMVFILAYLSYLFLGTGTAHLLLLTGFLYFTLKLRVYDIPCTKQHVGYKKVRLSEGDIELFYPTSVQVGRRDKRLFPQGVWNTMFEIVNKDTQTKSKLPWWVMYFTTHYYTRMVMHDTYPEAKPSAGCFPVMILSHQLGLNSLYSFAREFVDEGYVVISLIHREVIRNQFPGLAPNRPQRMAQLGDRVVDVQRALDFAQDKVKFSAVMGDDLKLDFTRVNAYGHSFGASTCISAAMKDNRINGLVIAMDPCLYILSDEETYTLRKLNYSKKTLIILAEDYYESHYPSFENDYRINIFRENVEPGSVISYRFMGSNHGSFSEMALIAEGQFRMFNVLRNNPDTKLFLELNISMIQTLIRNPTISSEKELLDTLIKQNPKYTSEILRVVRPLNHQEQQLRHRLYCEKKRSLG